MATGKKKKIQGAGKNFNEWEKGENCIRNGVNQPKNASASAFVAV